MGEMASFNNANLKMETQENTLLAKDDIEEEKQAKWNFLRTWGILHPIILESPVMTWSKSHVQDGHKWQVALWIQVLHADATGLWAFEGTLQTDCPV